MHVRNTGSDCSMQTEHSEGKRIWQKPNGGSRRLRIKVVYQHKPLLGINIRISIGTSLPESTGKTIPTNKRQRRRLCGGVRPPTRETLMLKSRWDAFASSEFFLSWITSNG